MTIPAAQIPFDEIIAFLAASPSTEQIIAYRPPEQLQARMSALLEKNRQTDLDADEAVELDELLRMNRFISRLQAKAKQHSGA